MRKKIFKKLSFLLALTMFISVFTPAAGVFAANEVKLNADKDNKRYIHLAKSKELANGNKTWFKFKLQNGPKKDNVKSIKWTSSKTSVATITKHGNVRAKAPGTTTITATVTPKKGKVMTAKAQLIVRDNIAKVSIKNPIPGNRLELGKEYDFNRSFVTDSASTKKTSGITRWVIRDSNGNNVSGLIDDKGIVKINKADEYTLNAVTFQSVSKYKEWLAYGASFEDKLVTAVSEDYKFEVGLRVLKAKQIEAKKFQLEFSGDIKDLVKKGNITLVDNKGNDITSIIKDATVKDKIATIETFTELTDKVKYTGKAANMDYSFTASLGEVDRIVIVKPPQVEAGVQTKLEVEFYDSNGIKVTGDTSKLSFEILNARESLSMLTDNQILMLEVGKTAIVKAKYLTGRLNDNWNEITIESPPFTIKAERDLSPIIDDLSNWGVFDKEPSSGADFRNPQKILAVNDNDKYIYAYAKDSEDQEILTGFEYESTNPGVLLVGKDGKLIPVQEGKVGVIVRNGSFNRIITIEVGSEAKAVGLEVNKIKDTISKTAGESTTFTIKAMNQYGGEETAQILEVESLMSPATVDKVRAQSLMDISKAGEATFLAASAPVKGTYVYKLSSHGLSEVVSVEVQEADSIVANYRFDIADIDTTVTDETRGNEKLNIRVSSYDRFNVKIEDNVPLLGGQITITGADGKVISPQELIYTKSGDLITSKLKAQRYTVTGTIYANTTNIIPAYFVVRDQQKPPNVLREGSTVTVASIANLQALFTSKGNEVSIKSSNVVGMGNTVVVKAVTVTETFKTGLKLETDVAVIAVITVK